MQRDPRYRARLNQISSTLETANLNTQASLWSFNQSYLEPCLTSISSCLESACYPCIGARRERVRARQRRTAATARGRPEFLFDFYNDEWDAEGSEVDERSGLLGGWGADELDRLLAGSGTGTAVDGEQPKRKQGMSYGATTASERRRRRSTLLAKGQGGDPTILPGSSMFGFLERLPWKIGGRGVRYKPSAADLQENPSRHPSRRHGHRHKDSSGEDGTVAETGGLLEGSGSESEGESPSYQRPGTTSKQKHRRNRSDTTTSRSTQNSLSSRGDLFPSEDEAADAVPLDDSFALSFARRTSDGELDEDGEEHELASPSPAVSGVGSSARMSLTNLTNRRSQSSKSLASSKRERRKSSLSKRSKSSTSALRRQNESGKQQSEMVHSPVTPLTPPAPSSRDERRSPWSLHVLSDGDDDAAIQSPINNPVAPITAIPAFPAAERIDDHNDVANKEEQVGNSLQPEKSLEQKQLPNAASLANPGGTEEEEHVAEEEELENNPSAVLLRKKEAENEP